MADKYYQVPKTPSEIIDTSGENTLTIEALPGKRNLVRAVYADILSGQTLQIELDDDPTWIYLTGPKQGGMIFRCGVQYFNLVKVHLSGTAGTKAYCGLVINV